MSSLRLRARRFKPRLMVSSPRSLPIAWTRRIEAHAVLHQLQHLVAADAGVTRENRGRAQGFGGRLDPVDVLGRVEDVIGLALGSSLPAVLLDHRYLVDDLQLAMGVTEGLAQGGEITIHRGLRNRRALSIAAPAGMF